MISPGEITKGMVLTVLEWAPVIQEPDGVFTLTQVVHRDNSYKGDVLDVEVVQLPFVIVRRRSGWPDSAITLDTRRVTLMELSADYIAAVTRKTKSP